MYVIVGSLKGEVFVIGHTSNRAKADAWVKNNPNGIEGEYDWTEARLSHPLR